MVGLIITNLEQGRQIIYPLVRRSSAIWSANLRVSIYGYLPISMVVNKLLTQFGTGVMPTSSAKF